MQCYTFYLACNATASTYIDMVQNGTIRLVQWAIVPLSGALATGDSIICQLSGQSSLQTANNAAEVMSVAGCQAQLTTSGGVFAGVHFSHGPMAIPVKATQRIFLTAVEAGAATWQVYCLVQVY